MWSLVWRWQSLIYNGIFEFIDQNTVFENKIYFDI